MARINARLEAARTRYREALEIARTNPTPEAWASLLAAGKELSAAEEPKGKPRRSRRRQLNDVSEAEAGEGGATAGPERSIDLGSTME